MSVVPQAMPDLNKSVVPAIDLMRQLLDKRAGQLDFNAPGVQSNERTAMEVRAMIGQNARVGQSQLSLFLPPWGRLMRNVVKRLCRADYDASLPGGKEAAKMRQRLVDAGFDIELLKAIDFDAVTCTQAVGAGSPAARQAAMMELEPMVAGYDAVGQHNFKRDKTASALKSYRAADRYIPRLPGDVRPPMDKQVASMENSLMELGKEQAVVVNQLHTVHIDTHLPHLFDMVERAEEDEAFSVESASIMALEHDHCLKHLEQIDGDPMIQEQTAMYRQALQQAGEVIVNAQRHADKVMRDQQAEGAEGGEAGQQDPEHAEKMAKMVRENNLKLRIMQDHADQKAAIRLQEFYQKKALRDLDAAAKITLQDRVAKSRARATKAA
jgi:hypothetical protein